MSRRKPRTLTEDEKMLWSEIAKRTEKLEKPIFRPKQTQSLSRKKKPEPKTIESKFSIGPGVKTKTATHDILPPLPDRLAAKPVTMDRKSFSKMRKGKLSPEGRIDLHGMTLSQAYPALVSFIVSAHSAGKRLVLIITGKGKDRDDYGPIPERRGVLRHQVPQWLAQGNISPLILQITEAHGKHGGGGAYYVYLRRRR